MAYRSDMALGVGVADRAKCLKGVGERSWGAPFVMERTNAVNCCALKLLLAVVPEAKANI